MMTSTLAAPKNPSDTGGIPKIYRVRVEGGASRLLKVFRKGPEWPGAICTNAKPEVDKSYMGTLVPITTPALRSPYVPGPCPYGVTWGWTFYYPADIGQKERGKR